MKLLGFWYRSTAILNNLEEVVNLQTADQFAVDRSLLLFHYATSAFLACEPVVDVALD